jgi:hypothetical protein
MAGMALVTRTYPHDVLKKVVEAQHKSPAFQQAAKESENAHSAYQEALRKLEDKCDEKHPQQWVETSPNVREMTNYPPSVARGATEEEMKALAELKAKADAAGIKVEAENTKIAEQHGVNYSKMSQKEKDNFNTQVAAKEFGMFGPQEGQLGGVSLTEPTVGQKLLGVAKNLATTGKFAENHPVLAKTVTLFAPVAGAILNDPFLKYGIMMKGKQAADIIKQINELSPGMSDDLKNMLKQKVIKTFAHHHGVDPESLVYTEKLNINDFKLGKDGKTVDGPPLNNTWELKLDKDGKPLDKPEVRTLEYRYDEPKPKDVAYTSKPTLGEAMALRAKNPVKLEVVPLGGPASTPSGPSTGKSLDTGDRS